MKTIPTLFLITSMLFSREIFAQGFVNLNFEAATITPTFPGLSSPINANTAIPGWTAYFGAGSLTSISYNGLSLGGANISLIDTNNRASLAPLQGRYSVLLEGSGIGTPTVASIGQTGQIPANALSLVFFFQYAFGNNNGSIQVTFNGQSIPIFQTGSTTNYSILSGDISAFAGQTGQLLFSAPPIHVYGFLDNIQFSASPIPEPSAFALTALGGGLLGWRRWHRNCQPCKCGATSYLSPIVYWEGITPALSILRI